MDYCNNTRSHGGHTNRGLPPIAFLNFYEAAEGKTHLDKLIKLGLIKGDAQTIVRLMSTGAALDLRDPGTSFVPTPKDGAGIMTLQP